MLRSNNFITSFLKLESASGILLIFATILALIAANSPLNQYYELLLATPVQIQVGALSIDKPLLLWINDGLMAIFFFLVGLELKRELIEGELSNKKNIILPGVGAIGGMALPALIYLYFNHDDPVAVKGWAIPAATDIAFALGILSLLGSRVPISCKIFVTSLAIFDDVGAILIIAIFYTTNISMSSLLIVAICLCVLFYINHRNVISKTMYITIGFVMWVAMLKSGVHATLVGILLAMFIPMKSNEDESISPLKDFEHDLHTTVAFIILPVFAFANAGLDLSNINASSFTHPVSLGIASGLYVGKLVGIFCCCWLVVKMKFTEFPNGINSQRLLGLAGLCGIGFTMSMFIGSLAFQETGVNQVFDERLGIIFGSLLSGLTGYIILNKALDRKEKT
ncbi:MAG: Na+/H+ antiporter NhaA [Pseudomonadota bacterium]